MSRDEERLLSGQAWRDWCGRLAAVGDAILAPDFPDAPGDRAEGVRWLTRLVTHATRQEIEAGDPLHPCFIGYETPHEQWGGPNPDNRYLRAVVDPAHTYRVWADVRGVRQAIFSLNEGDMQLGEFGVFSERSLADFAVGSDGLLSFWLAPEQWPGNWLPGDARGRLLSVRIYQGDWQADAAPRFHIERVGAEGVPRPPLDPAALAVALGRAATWVEKTATFWNGYTRSAWQRSTPNVPSPARVAPGGADDILYGSCCWELAEDEALLIECDAPDADYWGFSLHTLGWLESGDFDQRQTSLSHRQAHLDADGRLRLVLAQVDPGAPNWIDVGGRPRGMLVYRYVWARNAPLPRAQRVPLADLRERLPVDHPVVDAAARRASLARRREQAWNRFQ